MSKILLTLSCVIFLLVQGCDKEKGIYIESVTKYPVEHVTGKALLITYTPLLTNTPVPTAIKVPGIICNSDKDNDGINDLNDIIEGARKDAENKPAYKSEYYMGGYPPDGEGVCTDVIWRAFKNAGYNLKDMIDKDIKAHTKDYPNVEGKPDPNIDFRRVRNLIVFFKKYSVRLTTEIKPYDIDTLKEWQGGDIVTFGSPEHIVIVSDKRRDDGIPYIIHNAGPYTMEADNLMTWIPGITGHFRFPKQ